jgi:hypothetical protein
MKQLHLSIYRQPTALETTMGDLHIEGKKFCETLEDAIRNTKIDGKTCIPAGVYDVKVTMSSRFKRLMPLLYNTPKLTCEGNGQVFAGVRLHGGNTHVDTHGCPLVAYKEVNATNIQGTAERGLTQKIMTHLEQDPIWDAVAKSWKVGPKANLKSTNTVKLEIFNPK